MKLHHTAGRRLSTSLRRTAFMLLLGSAWLLTGTVWAQLAPTTTQAAAGNRGGVPTTFSVDPGWQSKKFPEHAVCYQAPTEIAKIFERASKAQVKAVVSYDKPSDGSLRIVGTGHSFMAPGYTTLPLIARAAGYMQPPLVTHTGGGITGSARYKWEQENGIFQFEGRALPKLLSSISCAQWDVMMWGPYYNDRKEFYSCWMDFCLKYSPEMKFYLSDAWPQLDQLDKLPASEDELTTAVVARMHEEKRETYGAIVNDLNREYGQRVFVLPTSRAMVLAVEGFHRGELPGVEGIHRVIGGKERSLWRDRLGHLGVGLESLEGYVFYATLYGRSPELIEHDEAILSRNGYPSAELDRVFRKIAWQATISDPLSGVVDANHDGIADEPQKKETAF